MPTTAIKMLEKCDAVSTPPAQEVTRDILTEHATCETPNFKVPDHLLDLMAEDDKSKHLAALKSLKETRKITRAESYLRKKFRYSR